MSRTTVHYIQMPKLKSFLTSCRRARARCQTLFAGSKPRRWQESNRLAKVPAVAPEKEAPAATGEVKPPEPTTVK